MGKNVIVKLTGVEARGETESLGKNVTVKLTGVEAGGEAGSLSWTKAREYWKKRPLLLLGVILLTLGSPFLGLILGGWVGVVVGLLVSIATFAGGLFAISPVREITRPQ
jgi:hypothetical protein